MHGSEERGRPSATAAAHPSTLEKSEQQRGETAEGTAWPDFTGPGHEEQVPILMGNCHWGWRQAEVGQLLR